MPGHRHDQGLLPRPGRLVGAGPPPRGTAVSGLAAAGPLPPQAQAQALASVQPQGLPGLLGEAGGSQCPRAAALLPLLSSQCHFPLIHAAASRTGLGAACRQLTSHPQALELAGL